MEEWITAIKSVGNKAYYEVSTSSLIPSNAEHGLSQDLETGCPNEGFIDFWVSKVWYKVHTPNEINHIYLQILLF